MFTDLIWKGKYFQQADGGGTAAAGAATSTDNSTGAQAVSGDQAATANADQAGDDKDKGKPTQPVTFTAEQQTAVDQIVKDRLAREKKNSEAAAEKVRKQAEEDALTKNKEFETLATTRQGKITELEAQVAELNPFKEQAEKYKSAIDGILKAQVEKLPKAIKPLVEKMDPLEKMKYLADNAKELNIEVIGVPETETSDSTNRLNEEAVTNAKKANAQMVKSFLSG